MYTEFFQLQQAPFSLSPDPRYLFMSQRHREAMAHLLYGLGNGGGLVLLTGEIGAGKTTLCRSLLAQVPDSTNLAYLFNPHLSARELLQSVCDEFRLESNQAGRQPEGRADSLKHYLDLLNTFLLGEHAQGRQCVLIIDEAQSLSAEVIEQLRLLTNLETAERKLLQIILIGQPELRELLAQDGMAQVAQRVIARYHLAALGQHDTAAYIAHRLTVAGWQGGLVFEPAAVRLIQRRSGGIPRRINVLCDRAMLGAYTLQTRRITPAIVRQAAREVFDERTAFAHFLPLHQFGKSGSALWRWPLTLLFFVGAGIAIGMLINTRTPAPSVVAVRASSPRPEQTPVRLATPKPDAPAPTVADPATLFPLMATALAPLEPGLLQRWSPNGATLHSCAEASRAQLGCYQSQRGFSELLQLNRPAILQLQDGDGQARFVTLTSLENNLATVEIQGRSYRMNSLQLAPYFQGEFTTAWRIPTGYKNKLRLGDQGPAVAWMAGALAKLRGAEERSERRGGPNFDLPLAKQLGEFQRSLGLKPDMVAGPRTFMLLNRASGVVEPKLSSPPQALAQAQAEH